MHIEVIDIPLGLTLYEFSGTAINKDSAGTAFKLMDRMWKIVKLNNLKNKGLNIWVYDQNENVFAGVELNEVPDQNFEIEIKNIMLSKYVYYKHTGPYHLIGKAVQNMNAEIKTLGLESSLLYIEIYGHWTNDESKLETELLMSLK